MTVRWPSVVCLGMLIGLAGTTGFAGSLQNPPSRRAPLGGIAFDERLGSEAALLPQLPRSTVDLPPLVVRIATDLSSTSPARMPALLTDLDRRVNAYAARRVRIVIALGGFPATDEGVENWRDAVRAVAEHGRGRAAAYQIGETGGTTPPAIDRYVFLLKLASVQLRSIDPDAFVIQGSVPAGFDAWQAALYAAGIAPYVDGLAIAGPAGADDEGFRAAVERLSAATARNDPAATVMLGPIALSGTTEAASALFFDSEVRALGTAVRVTTYAGSAGSLRAVLGVAARAADLLSGTIVTVDERTAALRLSRGSTDLTAAIPHKLLFSTTRFATYLVYNARQEAMPFTVDVTVTDAMMPESRDPVAGTTAKLLRAQTQGTRISVTAPVARHSVMLDFNAGAVDRVVENADVQTDRLPKVAEIIARHQQAQAAQDAAVTQYIAHMRIEQHLRPSAADIDYNTVTENRVFFDRGAVEWEQLSFAFNGATWTSNPPSVPLVQPEKVLSVPLDLRLTEDYVYRLEGIDMVGERPAYAVHFEPVGSSQKALYRGTVWIDREQYVRLKVHAVELHLTGSVVSNDETTTFGRVGDLDGRSVWLLDRLISKQTFLIAGKTVPLEREARISNVTLNPPTFEADRTEARASNRIMYRDTDKGLRYFVKQGNGRVVSEQMTSSTKAFALGAQVDPSFDYPLPLGGLDVLDFNFLHKDMQFALLFAGVFAAGNLQRPNLWGGRFDASVDFFGLAVGSNDSIFDAQGEHLAERVRRVPGATGVNVGFQATPFQKIAGHYEFRFDGYFRDPNTAPEFTLPASTGTHGLGVGYEYRRAGYSVVGNVMKHRRTTVAPWGAAGDLQTPPQTFTQFDVGASKDFIFPPFQTIHFNGAYFGGDQLDRFSMYQFGFFDAARMHGVPSAVRFAELAMFRGSYSFNIFGQYRIDLFLDHARGRNPQTGDAWEPLTGVGLGLNLRAPRNTIFRADLGKSFLPDAYRGAGSVVLQIMLLKPL